MTSSMAITRTEAEETFQTAVNDARLARDQAIESAWHTYRQVLEKMDRDRQESVDKAWRELTAVEVRATDECTEVIDKAYKAYREVVPVEPPAATNKGGQP